MFTSQTLNPHMADRAHETTPGIMDDCARLARDAERYGAEGQGTHLAQIAKCLARNDIEGAMTIRDQILRDLSSAKGNRWFSTVLGSLFAAYVVMIFWMMLR